LNISSLKEGCSEEREGVIVVRRGDGGLDMVPKLVLLTARRDESS
jgi:hypothetical protein